MHAMLQPKTTLWILDWDPAIGFVRTLRVYANWSVFIGPDLPTAPVDNEEPCVRPLYATSILPVR